MTYMNGRIHPVQRQWLRPGRQIFPATRRSMPSHPIKPDRRASNVLIDDNRLRWHRQWRFGVPCGRRGLPDHPVWRLEGMGEVPVWGLRPHERLRRTSQRVAPCRQVRCRRAFMRRGHGGGSSVRAEGTRGGWGRGVRCGTRGTNPPARLPADPSSQNAHSTAPSWQSEHAERVLRSH